MINMIEVKAYAKINLALEVKDIIDGYHMVNNLMIPIDLYDVLTFEISDKIELINNEFEDNIILKAAKLFISKFNINSGVRISLTKNIPSAAGLAGGSSDAGATLRGLNELFNFPANHEDLLEMAEALGSDVPFFIDTKFALCTGRGEKVNIIDSEYKPFNILLIKPKSGLSTKDVYKAYEYDGIDKSDTIDDIIDSVINNDISLLIDSIFNDLTIPALKLNKELNTIFNDLKNKTNIFLSGSGPTMFIINPNKDIENYIKNKYSDCFIMRCKTM